MQLRFAKGRIVSLRGIDLHRTGDIIQKRCGSRKMSGTSFGTQCCEPMDAPARSIHAHWSASRTSSFHYKHVLLLHTHMSSALSSEPRFGSQIFQTVGSLARFGIYYAKVLPILRTPWPAAACTGMQARRAWHIQLHLSVKTSKK